MFIKCVLAVAAVVSAPISSGVSVLGAPVEAQGVEKSIIGGTWTGSFLQKDWTFEFRNEDGRLQGRYMRSGGRNWQPLNEIRVSGRSVSFSIESKPKVSFALEVDAADRNMSGTVTIDGMATVPFSAARIP